MTSLKLCPFCGSTPNSGCNYGIGGAYVHCVNRECACNPEVFIAAVHNSDASLSLDDALVMAKAAWNKRIPDEPGSPTQSEMEEAVKITTMALRKRGIRPADIMMADMEAALTLLMAAGWRKI